jgi:hypothetical protein
MTNKKNSNVLVHVSDIDDMKKLGFVLGYLKPYLSMKKSLSLTEEE